MKIRRPLLRVRVPIELSVEDTKLLDQWAERNDFGTRTSAIRAIIRRAAREMDPNYRTWAHGLRDLKAK